MPLKSDPLLERAFLARVLNDPDQHATLASLDPTVFSSSDASALAAAMRVLWMDEKPVTLQALTEFFAEREEPLPGGPDFLLLPPEGSAPNTAKAWRRLESLSARRKADMLLGTSLGDAARAAIPTFEARGAGRLRPIEMPWPSLNELVDGGLFAGCYQIVAGTGAGKSQFSLQIAMHAARENVPVHYVALELSADEIVARVIGLCRNVRWSTVWRGRDGGAPYSMDWLKRAGGEVVRSLPNFTIEAASPRDWTYESLLERGEALRSLYPEADRLLLVVDFLQLVEAPKDERVEVRQRVSRAVYAAREVARQYGVTVLVISSTSRENYNKLVIKEKKEDGEGTGEFEDPPRPNDVLGLGKESGDTEYASDGVLVLAHKDIDKMPRDVACILAKSRTGPTGMRWLRWDGSVFTGPPVRGAVVASTPATPTTLAVSVGASFDHLIK